MPVNMDKLVSLDRAKEIKTTENGMIATVEASSTASKAYAVGEYFYYTGKLYKATAPIASGGTITVGTNCALAKLADDVGNLKSAFSSEIDALNGTSDNVGVTTVSNWSQIGTSGVYAKTDNGDLLLYGTASASRWYVCLNGQDFIANTSTAFAQTLPAGTYKLNISTESTVPSLHYLYFTYSTFSTGEQYQWIDGATFSPTNPVMLGLRLISGQNYGTSESPMRVSISITQYKEKASRSYVDEEMSDTEAEIGVLSNLTTTAKSNLVAAVNEVDANTDKNAEKEAYIRQCDIDGVIPYGIIDSSDNILDVEQDGNVIKVSGSSSASSSQGTTKILICGHSATWNAVTPSEVNDVRPIKTINGHIYKVSIEFKSGTITSTATSGLGLATRVNVRGTGYIDVLFPLRYISEGHTYAEYTFTGNGNNIALLFQIGYQTTLTNAVFEIKLRDITFDQLNTTITNRSALMTETIISKATLNYYWKNEDGTAVNTYFNGNYSSFDPIEVEPHDRILVHIYGGHSSAQNPVLVVTENLKILTTYTGTRDAWNDFDFEIPDGGKYVLLTTTSISAAIRASCSKVTGIRPITSYDGCKLSLLGDSFSAIDGYCDHDYYPNVGSDVYSGEQMWWKIVANQLGMTPLVIGGWSGSCVTDGIRDGYTPASDPARCEALGNGDDNPDVVFIAMGVNDYSYMSNESQFGTWDGTTALGSESDLSDYDTTTFKTAYATMLARIQKAYPSAFIVAITPWFQKRRSTDTGVNYLNAIGKSIYDYAEAVREICGIMHVPVINGTDIGFNRRNYYPTYSSDSASTTTHPTIAGQAQIAKAVIEQLKTLHRLGS